MLFRGQLASQRRLKPPWIPSRPPNTGVKLDLRHGREIGFDQSVGEFRLFRVRAAFSRNYAFPLGAHRRTGWVPARRDQQNLVARANPVKPHALMTSCAIASWWMVDHKNSAQSSAAMEAIGRDLITSSGEVT
jgi:hypothetical protein